MNIIYKLSAILIVFTFACNKSNLEPVANKKASNVNHVVTTLVEGFEGATKTSYTAADAVLSSGTWNLNDALIGNSASDPKVATNSARVRNSGKLTMKFDKTTGAGIVTVQHAKYGADANGTWQLWYSTNSGVSYLQAGNDVSTSATTLATASFTINVAGNVRIEIRKTDAGTNRINFDEITINDYTSASNPIPTLTNITPNTISAGAGAFTLTVNGSNFISNSVIKWNGNTLTTNFVSATQLTASVAASAVATAGTASVTVFSPAPGGGTSASANFTINAVSTTKKFLFDAKHAETAGNADWVIDQDNSPQRIPTPAQSTITAGTSETYWKGAISAWGIALAKLGHTVETLPTTGTITYGNTANAQDLSKYDVFVIDEPNTIFTSSEKTAILQFVQNGGGLCMISDHTISDRNNDGWDSPEIWNDLFTNNTVQSNPFGFSVDYNDISVTSSNVFTGSHPVMNGTAGNVTQVQFNNGATISINTTANPNAKGLVWRSGYTQNNSNIMSAVSTFGNGRAFIFGDSSPVDDGTGAAGNVLYNGWGVYSHTKLMMNASLWLAKVQ
jgi:hypothetical protein